MDRRSASTPRRLLAALTALGISAGMLSLGAAPASVAPCAGPTVAAIGTGPHQANVVATLQATCLFAQVDGIDGLAGGTPTLATLNGYDAVLVYSDFGFADNVAMGDVLADYVDGGGRVVVAALAFWTSDHTLGMGGRLSTGGYLPFTQAGQTAGGPLELQADRSYSRYLANVGSFSCETFSIMNSVSLADGARQIAHWSNLGQTPLVAVKGRVVGLNFFPANSDDGFQFWDVSTDGDVLMANALLGGGVPQGDPAVQVTVGRGLETQTKTIAPGDQATFEFAITNTGVARDRFTVLGADDGLVIRYLEGRTDVTAGVLAGTYVTPRRAPGRSAKILLEVQVAPDELPGATYELALVGTSVTDPSVSDGASAAIDV